MNTRHTRDGAEHGIVFVCLLVWRMMKEEKNGKEKKKLKSKYSQNKIQTREEENWWKAMDGVQKA